MPLLPGTRYWVPHKEEAYVPAMYKGPGKDGSALFVDPSGQEHSMPEKNVETLSRVVDSQLDGVSNICTLQEVTEAAVLQTVKVRYMRKIPQVYTSVAQILIAVNPFQNLPIYGNQTMKKYLEASDVSDLEPHIFSIGHYALRGISRDGDRNQVVLISGESGAGKTESTKLILSYTAEAISGGKEGEIQDKIMRSNPILESFGNAMTVRNNNSSRFGKFIDIRVGLGLRGKSIKGCMINEYLLEQTRVTSQAPGERNYHVFFQLLYAKGMLDHLQEDGQKIEPLRKPKDYRYIRNSKHEAPNIDDAQFLEEHLEAYQTFDIAKKDQCEFFRIVIGVLTLGNVEFEPSAEQYASVTDTRPVKDAAKLLAIDPEPLQSMLEKRLIRAAGDCTETGRTVPQAEAARDGIARKLYGRLFKYIVRLLNETLVEGSTDGGQYLGVLDIAGFESFETNSIEQLLINLSNEHLQAHFNTQIFATELADYTTEGVEVGAKLTYKDNSDIINLIDSKNSLLSKLDDHISVPKATDKSYLEGIISIFGDHTRFVKPRFGAGACSFGVQHFAGVVTYAVAGFLEKNVDRPPDECVDVLKASNLGVLRAIGEAMQQEIADNFSSGRKKMRTVSSTFRSSLGALMSKISTADPHFIRCIKPNSEKIPNEFSPVMVMNQLSFSGVFEAVRIRQSGFSVRMVFKDFVFRYRAVLPKGSMRSMDELATCQYMEANMASIVSCVGEYTQGDIILGKTKAFLRTKLVQLLDKAYALSVVEYAIMLQKTWRGVHTRKMMKHVLLVNKTLTRWLKDNRFYSAPGFENTAVYKLKEPQHIKEQLERLVPAMQEAKELILPLKQSKQKNIEKISHRMKMEMDLVVAVGERDKSTDPLDLERLVSRSKELELSHLPQIKALKARITALKVQLPLYEALLGIGGPVEDHDLDQFEEVEQELVKHKLDVEPNRWLAELDGAANAAILLGLVKELRVKRDLEIEAEKKRAAEAAAAAKAANKPLPPTKDPVSPGAGGALKPPPKPNRKPTITNITEEEVSCILLDLMSAMEVYDADRLGAALGKAIRHGVKEHDVLNEASDMNANLGREDFLILKIHELCKNLRDKVGDENNNSASLKNVRNQAQKLGVAEDSVRTAQVMIQERFRKRVRNTWSRSAFEENDVDKGDMFVDDAFADLGQYKQLRNKNTWQGHSKQRAVFLDRSVGGGPEAMLKHNPYPLKQSLTRLNGDHSQLEPIALRTFKDILGWMHDNAKTELTRVNLIQDITQEASKEPRMASEIYIQVMKQLTNNPSKRSLSAGWKLMHAMVQTVCPPGDLREYVHVFILRAMQVADASEDRTVLEQCIADLNRTAAPEKKDTENFPVTVTLLDHSKRRVYANMSTTVSQLGEMVREQLGLRKEMDWCLFQSAKGLELVRLIPQDVTVAATLSRWNQFKVKFGKESQFVFRRRFLTAKESLDPAYPNDCRLTFVQALDDYRRYPIMEPIRFIADVAARILFLDHELYTKQVRPTKDPSLTAEGLLEQLVPSNILREHSRKQLSNDILRLFYKHPREGRHVTMGRCFQLMQRMKLFGSVWWLGKQVFETEPDLVTISDKTYNVSKRHWASKHGVDTSRMEDQQQCKLNPKNKKGEYLLAVDYWGIRFMQYTDRPDAGQQVFSRGFMFNEDSWERMLMFGGKGTLVQFLVTTVDPDTPEIGRVPMRINFQTRAAVDICFTLQTLFAYRGQDNPQTKSS